MSNVYIDDTPVAKVEIDGRTLEMLDPDALATELRVSRSSGAAGTAQLWIDMHWTDADDIMIGQNLKISVVSLDDSQADALFEGPITSIGIEHDRVRTQLIIGAHDASYLLGQTTVSKSRLNMSAKAIITSIAADFGLTVDIDAKLGVDAFEHVQESGTAHQFITEIARTFGCEWFVEGTKLVIRPRTSSTPIVFRGGQDLRRFSARFSSIDQAAAISVRRWDPTTKAVLTASADLSTSPELGGTSVPITRRARRSSADHKPLSGVTNPGRGVGPADLAGLAQGIVGRHEAAMLTGRGEVGVRPELVPGAQIKLEDVKTEWNGTYYVTAVEHVFGGGNTFVSRFTVGELEPTTLVDLLGTPSMPNRERLATSLAIGLVTDNEDPDGLNRVKVVIPALSDDNESWWARLISSGAGSGRGWVVVPEVHDEVVIAFEHGDIQRPYILGGLWNGTEAPPAVDELITNGHVMSRSFTSRLGHRLEFRDGTGDDDKFICMTLDNSTTKLYLGSDKIEVHSADKNIQLKTGNATIDLTEEGDIKIKAKNIELDASQNIDLKAKQNITLDATQNASLKGGMNADIEGKAGAKLQSSGQAVVKGAMVKIN